jgi:anti-sigma-K factor RskA
MDISNYISSGIIELYVMGLCSEEEEKELEGLRRQHPALHEAILQYEKDLEKNMQKNITLPPVNVDEKILQSLDSLQTPVISMNALPYNRTRKMQWLKPAAAAAIALLAVSAFFNYSLYKKTKKQEHDLQAASGNSSSLPVSDYNILKDPAITPVAMYGQGIHSICRCTMFWDKKTGKAYIMIHHLVKSPDNKNYQLWAMVDNKPISVGIINDKIRDRFIEMNSVPEGAVAFMVTLEKTGGNTTPTEEETYLKGRI